MKRKDFIKVGVAGLAGAACGKVITEPNETVIDFSNPEAEKQAILYMAKKFKAGKAARDAKLALKKSTDGGGYICQDSFGTDDEYYYDDTNCTGCEECREACPVDVFVMQDGKACPVFVDKCISCDACEPVCQQDCIIKIH